MDGIFTAGNVCTKPEKDGGCSVYRFRNESGEGTITVYEVFPGALLSYNDFHIRDYSNAWEPPI